MSQVLKSDRLFLKSCQSETVIAKGLPVETIDEEAIQIVSPRRMLAIRVIRRTRLNRLGDVGLKLTSGIEKPYFAG